MIEEIRIENLGVIGAAHLELSPTLTVITGETGAGKTMVLTGLSLLLGGRADPGSVRPGALRAVVDGVLVEAGPTAEARAREAGAELDEGALLITRAVVAEGRSRSYLGGRAVPQAVLAEIAADLVTVHGQSDQLRLRAPGQQRSALDAFAGPDHLALLEQYRETYGERSRAREALARWDTEAAAREEEVLQLRNGVRVIDGVTPLPGEDMALREEAERLGHAEDLRLAAGLARDVLAGDVDGKALGNRGTAQPGYAGPSDAVGALDRARRALDPVAAVDPRLGEAAGRLEEIGYLVSDVVVDLGSYLADLEADLEADQARLEAVHERRAVLADLVRRYAPSARGEPPRPVADVLAWAESARARLEELADPGLAREVAAVRVTEAERRLAVLAADLAEGRRRAAHVLEGTVDAELEGLAMAGAHLEIRLSPLAEPGPWGAEDVELWLVAHPGAPARPLAKGASGGELSRVMLALEVALARGPGDDAVPQTFVFDEVDAGVGGRAAIEVGRRLADLAGSAQVVVITHLAQVAAFADRHLVVTKTTRGGEDVVTSSDVRAVQGPERVRELARMLSGREDSDTARRHAAELLAHATVGR